MLNACTSTQVYQYSKWSQVVGDLVDGTLLLGLRIQEELKTGEQTKKIEDSWWMASDNTLLELNFLL